MLALLILGSIIVLWASKFVIAYIGIRFSSLSQWLITSSGTEGGALFSAGLGAARAFDFGGPVNKMAGTIGKQLYFDTGYSYIALVLGALSCLILGFLGISEVVLPFIILYPVIIPISMIGTAVAGAIGFSLGASVFPGGIYSFYMWPLIENVWGFLIALAVGVLIVCTLMFFYRLRVYNKEQEEQVKSVE
jgi:PTS system fructose-specific IIC component